MNYDALCLSLDVVRRRRRRRRRQRKLCTGTIDTYSRLPHFVYCVKFGIVVLARTGRRVGVQKDNQIWNAR